MNRSSSSFCKKFPFHTMPVSSTAQHGPLASHACTHYNVDNVIVHAVLVAIVLLLAALFLLRWWRSRRKKRKRAISGASNVTTHTVPHSHMPMLNQLGQSNVPLSSVTTFSDGCKHLSSPLLNNSTFSPEGESHATETAEAVNLQTKSNEHVRF